MAVLTGKVVLLGAVWVAERGPLRELEYVTGTYAPVPWTQCRSCKPTVNIRYDGIAYPRSVEWVWSPLGEPSEVPCQGWPTFYGIEYTVPCQSKCR